MADVFISYAREDRDQAERLARALGAEGLQVWWDEESLHSGGESFSHSIDKALKDARCVLVLWSHHSIASDWVDAEALGAWNEGKLHSVWLEDDVPVRVPFNASHARNLSDWDGNADFPELRRLLADIRAPAQSEAGDGVDKGMSGQGERASAKGRGTEGRQRILLTLLGLAAPTAISLAATLVLMQWHRPTRVELDLTLDRLAFTVAPTSSAGPASPVELMNQGQMGVVQAERVTRVVIDQRTTEVADPTRYDRKSGRYPEDAWHPLPIQGEAVLEPSPGFAGVQPSVVLQSEDPAVPGTIKVVRAGAGTELAIEAGMEGSGDQPWLTLDLASSGAQLDLVFPMSFLLFADAMEIRGIGGASVPPGSLSLRAPDATDTLVSVLGSERGLVLQLEPNGSAETLLDGIQIPVSTVDFTRQGPTGERQSTLIGPGSLGYPDLSAKGKLDLSAGDFVSLDGLEDARIRSLGITGEAKHIGLKLRLVAVVSKARVGAPEQPRDVRLTWFDWLRYDQTWAVLFAIAVWFFTTTLAGYKLWQGLRSSRAPS